jgi:hypothetical protein
MREKAWLAATGPSNACTFSDTKRYVVSGRSRAYGRMRAFKGLTRCLRVAPASLHVSLFFGRGAYIACLPRLWLRQSLLRARLVHAI